MSDIISDIKALIPQPCPLRRWDNPTNPEHAEIIRAVADAWLSGELGTIGRHVAPAVAQRLNENGIQVSASTVREWLTRLKRS